MSERRAVPGAGARDVRLDAAAGEMRGQAVRIERALHAGRDVAERVPRHLDAVCRERGIHALLPVHPDLQRERAGRGARKPELPAIGIEIDDRLRARAGERRMRVQTPGEAGPEDAELGGVEIDPAGEAVAERAVGRQPVRARPATSRS